LDEKDFLNLCDFRTFSCKEPALISFIHNPLKRKNDLDEVGYPSPEVGEGLRVLAARNYVCIK
jgi:hypothetical protein